MWPKTFMMMQAWCATTARPDSETRFGSGTPSLVQTRWRLWTMSPTYSSIE